MKGNGMTTKVRRAKRFGAQGDLLLRVIKAGEIGARLEGFRPTQGEQDDGGLVVAHSESGHHHVAVADRPVEYLAKEGDPMTSFLRALENNTKVQFEHRRGYDTHDTVLMKLQAGDVIRLRRQRESVPEGWRAVQD